MVVCCAETIMIKMRMTTKAAKHEDERIITKDAMYSILYMEEMNDDAMNAKKDEQRQSRYCKTAINAVNIRSQCLSCVSNTTTHTISNADMFCDYSIKNKQKTPIVYIKGHFCIQ